MKRLPVRIVLLIVFAAAALLLSFSVQSYATAQSPRISQTLDTAIQPDHPFADPALRAQIPADWYLFENAVWNISLRYPPDWEVTAVPYRGFGVRFSSPDLQWDNAGQVIQGSYFWIDVATSSMDVPPLEPLRDLDGVKQTTWVAEGRIISTESVTRISHPSPSVTELILSSITLTGQPEDYPTLPLNTVKLTEALKLPFPNGNAHIASGGGYNNNSNHKNYDKYSLDFCLPDPNCQLSNFDDYYVLAPTNLTYIDNATNQTDYYFFEIAADTEPSFKLCMSLGHFDLKIPIKSNDSILQGTVLGNLSSYSPPHWHMGIWATAKSQDCRADPGRVPIPYEDWSANSPGGWTFPPNPGDFRLDGVSYPACDGGQCTNVHAHKKVTSTNVARCYNPNTNPNSTNGQFEGLAPDFNPADCFTTNTSNVDVALIIDSSGSMADNDPNGKRLDAAKAYLTASLPGDYVGVVDFDSSARVPSPLQRLPENKDALIAAIDTINSSGGTNIGIGVEAGCGVLQGIPTPNLTKGAILLTDGQGNYDNQAQCFIDNGWPIYAFGFGDADDTLLEQIATSTGGEYKRLPTSNLVCEFQGVRTKIAGGQPSQCTAQIVEPNETVQFPVSLLERLLKVTFSISWPGSDVELSLVSPTGRIIDRNTNAPDVEHDLGATYESYGINNPEQGKWQVKLFGADVPAGGEEVVFNYATIMDPSPPGGIYLPIISAPSVTDSLAFTSDHDGNDEIYLMNSDGSNITRLTNNPANDWAPAWSPDGNWLAFTSDRDGDAEIYVMRVNGTGLHKLTDNTAYDCCADWSPDGTKIAFNSNYPDGDQDIYVINVDGTGRKNLTNFSADDWSPEWSPNGAEILFDARRDGHADIYVMNADGTNPRRLTTRYSAQRGGHWSPGGQKIVYHSNQQLANPDQVGYEHIFMMRRDGTLQTQLTHSAADDMFPDWHDNGHLIVFTSWRNGNGEIYVMNQDGTGVKQITNHPAEDVGAVWRP